MNNERKCV